MTALPFPASGGSVIHSNGKAGKTLFFLILIFLGIWALASLCAVDSVPPVPGATTDLTWHDDARNRDVPVRIYTSRSGTPPFPVIVFSPGLGGSREGYAYLGSYWATHGYVSIVVQHLGSDSAVAQSTETLIAAMRNPKNYTDRPKDISFAIDRLAVLNQEPGPWKNRLDLGKIGVAGHSFGAYTTMAIAGTAFPFPTMEGLADPRVKAIVAMSVPSMPGARYTSVHLPALHFTGTEDAIHIQNSPVEDRRIPFDQSPGPDTYLVVFQGGDHMVFSGRLANPRPNDTLFQDLVCRGSTAFWDAYLKGDVAAKAWLAEGGFKGVLDSHATFEKK